MSVLALAVAGALTAPAPATAAVASELGTTLTYQAAPGEVNNIRIIGFTANTTTHPGIPFTNPFYLIPPGGNLTLGAGCAAYKHPIAAVADNICQRAGIARIVMRLGDLNDEVTLAKLPTNDNSQTVLVPALINGGLGNDDLTGGDGDDDITGGGGVNTARGLDGNDRLRMRNRLRDTVIDCGNGVDTAFIDRIDPRPVGCETVLRAG